MKLINLVTSTQIYNLWRPPPCDPLLTDFLCISAISTHNEWWKQKRGICYIFYIWGGQDTMDKIQVATEVSECFLESRFVILKSRYYLFSTVAWFSLMLCHNDFSGFNLLLSQITLKRLKNLRIFFQKQHTNYTGIVGIAVIVVQIQKKQKYICAITKANVVGSCKQ